MLIGGNNGAPEGLDVFQVQNVEQFGAADMFLLRQAEALDVPTATPPPTPTMAARPLDPTPTFRYPYHELICSYAWDAQRRWPWSVTNRASTPPPKTLQGPADSSK